MAIVIVIIAGLFYFLSDYGTLVTPVLTPLRNASLFKSPGAGGCTSQVNGLIKGIEAEVPTGSEVTVVNTTAFSYNADSNITLGQILAWAKAWSSQYSSSRELPAYVKNDASYAAIGNNRTGQAGVGEAIKVTVPAGDFESGSSAESRITPVLCDSGGVSAAGFQKQHGLDFAGDQVTS